MVAASPAQAGPAEDFPDANAVLSRQRPGLDPVGLRLANFTVLPSLTAGLLYDDNVFDTDVARNKSAIYTIEPRVAVRSDWGINHLNLDASGLLQRYTSVHRANFEEARFSGDGQFQVASAVALLANGHFNRQAEPRGTSDDLFPGSDPIIYRNFGGGGGAIVSLGRMELRGNGSIDRYVYNDAKVGPDTLSQHYRDHNSIVVGGQVGFEVGPGILTFVSGSYNKERYDDRNSATDLSSHEGTVLGGVDFKITNLMRGRIGVGYFRRNYSSSAFRSISGFDYDASIVWNPTTLLTVSVEAAKKVEESPLVNVAGITANTAGVRLDWEVLRKLIVDAHLDYAREKYKDFDRRDNRLEPGIGLRYLANRFVEVGLHYDRRDQWGHGAFGRTYRGDAVRLSITVQR